MKDMNRVKVTVIGVIAALAVNFMGVDKVQAQEFKIQGDLVSSYVWRGFYQTGVSFQPTLGFGINNITITRRTIKTFCFFMIVPPYSILILLFELLSSRILILQR